MWIRRPGTNSWYLCVVYGHDLRSIRKKGVVFFVALIDIGDAGGDQLSGTMGMTFQESRVEVVRLSVLVPLGRNPIRPSL